MSTTTKTRAAEPTSENRAGHTIPAAPTLPAPKRRRRPALLAAGIILAVIGGLGAFALASSMSTRTSVVVAAADIAWGEMIDAADLVEARIAVDPALTSIPWEALATVIGHRADTALHRGALIGPADLMTSEVPPEGKALVGVAVKPGQLPATPLAAGQKVTVVRSAADGRADDASEPADSVGAIVFTAGESDSGAAHTVDVIVDQTDASTVANWSAAGVASIFLVAGR